MQKYHRNRHRLLWLLLGPLAISAFVYAIVNRPEMPVMDKLPGEGTTEGEAVDR